MIAIVGDGFIRNIQGSTELMYARMVLNGNPGLFTLNAGVRIASKRLNKVYVSNIQEIQN